MIALEKIINDAVQPTEEREKKRWYASDLGKCLRGAYYARQGVKPPKQRDDRTYRVFSVGRIFEDWVIEQVGKQIKIDRPETIYLPEYDIAVRPDMVIVENNIVYEIKTVHSRKFWWMENKKEGPDDHYLMQLYVGMMAMKAKTGRLVYVSKDDLAISEYEILLDDNDEYIKGRVLADIKTLNAAWEKQKPPPPVPTIINGKINWQARYCDYHALCTGNDNWERDALKNAL